MATCMLAIVAVHFLTKKSGKMRLKETLTTAVILGVGIFGVGIVLRRLKRKRRRGKKKKQLSNERAGKSSLPNLVSSVGGSSKHEIRFEDLVKLGKNMRKM